jgi:DNA-binding transcriptional MerR regulator
MDATEWTLDELAARVAEALDGPAYPGAPNGRVRDVPDARAIRWYSTIGLVDRPSGMRGRTALYGPRHLLQLVAVKRRQAQGHKLADIQAELAGAPDDDLRRIAGLNQMPIVQSAAAAAAVPRAKFWAERPAEPAVERPASPAEVSRLGGVHLDGGAMLLLPHVPTEADADAIREAARPLLDLLAARGLIVNKRTQSTAETTE